MIEPTCVPKLRVESLKLPISFHPFGRGGRGRGEPPPVLKTIAHRYPFIIFRFEYAT